MEPAVPPSPPPPVVAVLVTRDAPGDRLDEVLRALARQDYPNLDVVVLDAGSAGVSPGAVRAVVPAAQVHRVPAADGFGAAANTVLDALSGAEFLVFCHDDAAPEPGAVSAMVAAAERWSAGVVGPKLVRWDDARRFTQFGLAVDRVGVSLPYVLRDELDQGQHDGLRDVFAVPAAFTLVRAELFDRIGGFDEAISSFGDDLSLSWRARVAGARVVVAATARVRHAEACTREVGPAAAAARASRHRLRVLLTGYTPWSLALIVPQALVLSFVEAVGALFTGRLGLARAALGAWPWNLRRLGSLLDARRQVAAFRAVGDRAVRRSQVQGLIGPRLTMLRVGGETRAGGRRERAAAVPERGHMETDPAAWTPAAIAVAVCVASVVVFGSRHLLTRGVPAIGGLVPPGDSARGLLDAWASGWRPAGMGVEGATPTLAGVLGLLATVLGGHVGLARTALAVGLVPLGILGAHRLAAPTGAKRAQVAAAVAYAAVPLPYDALAAGRWSALGAWCAAPWMLGRLARSSGAAPFDGSGAGVPGTAGVGGGGEGTVPGPVVGSADDGGAGDPADRARANGDGRGRPTRRRHPLLAHVVVTGAVTALAGLLVPQAPALVLGMGLALAVGSVLAGELRPVPRLVAAAVGGAAVSAALLLPTTIDVLSGSGDDAWLAGDRLATNLRPLDVLGLRTGTATQAGIAVLVAVAAIVPVLVGRRWRLTWAIRAWTVALVGWALVWAGQQGWVTVPEPGVVLAPVASGLALAVGLGMAAVDHDVRGRSWRFGLRRLVVAAGVLALVGAAATPLVGAIDGRWGMPGDDFVGLAGVVDDDVADAPARVLWVGEDGLVPGGRGWDLDERLSYTASAAQALPGVADLWPASAGDEAGAPLGEALGVALAGDTRRLGALLAPLGVEYVAVPLRLAPSDDTSRAEPGAAYDLVAVLAEQLDLEHIGGDLGLVLYRNTAFVAGAGDVPATTPPGGPTSGSHALVAAQVVLWLVVAAVAVRLRFGAGERRSRSRRRAAPAAHGGAGTAPDRSPAPAAHGRRRNRREDRRARSRAASDTATPPSTVPLPTGSSDLELDATSSEPAERIDAHAAVAESYAADAFADDDHVDDDVGAAAHPGGELDVHEDDTEPLDSGGTARPSPMPAYGRARRADRVPAGRGSRLR